MNAHCDNLTFRSQDNRQRPFDSGLTVPVGPQHLEYQRLPHQLVGFVRLHWRDTRAFRGPRGRSIQWPSLSWPFPSCLGPSRCMRLARHRGSSGRRGGLVLSSAIDASLCGTSSSVSTWIILYHLMRSVSHDAIRRTYSSWAAIS